MSMSVIAECMRDINNSESASKKSLIKINKREFLAPMRNARCSLHRVSALLAATVQDLCRERRERGHGCIRVEARALTQCATVSEWVCTHAYAWLSQF